MGYGWRQARKWLWGLWYYDLVGYAVGGLGGGGAVFVEE